MMNNLSVTSNSTVSAGSCKGSACQKFKNSEEAAAAVVKVLGDRSIRTCKDATECGSGGIDNAQGTTIAGTGFAPMLEDTTKENLEQLIKLVKGTEAPTQANLDKIKSGSLKVTRGVIDALKRDPDAGALVQRLAGELAMSDTIETGLAMRRMLTTGQSEPNAVISLRQWLKPIAVLKLSIASLTLLSWRWNCVGKWQKIPRWLWLRAKKIVRSPILKKNRRQMLIPG